MSEQFDPIAQRYGSKKANPRLVIALAASLIGIFLIWAIWSVTEGIKPTFKTSGYTVIDESHVKVSFTVSKPSERAVGCAIQALKQDFGIVGFKEVKYPAGKDFISASLTLTTTEPAVTGLVDNCWFY